MAISRPSSAPVFDPGILLEDSGISYPQYTRGANQFLGEDASHHADQSTVGPRGNRVQDGALALLGTHSALGRPTKNNPTGAQNG
jgi:hypothetical protein